jgi:hypothetical protein
VRTCTANRGSDGSVLLPRRGNLQPPECAPDGPAAFPKNNVMDGDCTITTGDNGIC